MSEEKGFTLVELMIVIAIIGILAAIAIPQFTSYRERAYNAAAQTDAKNFYAACVADSTGTEDKTWTGADGSLPPGFTRSQGVQAAGGTFTYTASSGAITCNVAFKHGSGSKTYTLDDDGKITESDGAAGGGGAEG